MMAYLSQGVQILFSLIQWISQVWSGTHYFTGKKELNAFFLYICKCWGSELFHLQMSYEAQIHWILILLPSRPHGSLSKYSPLSVYLYTASLHFVTDSLLGVECCLTSSQVILTIWNICQHTHTHREPYLSISVILPIWNVCPLSEWSHAEYTVIVHRGVELLAAD